MAILPVLRFILVAFTAILPLLAHGKEEASIGLEVEQTPSEALIAPEVLLVPQIERYHPIYFITGKPDTKIQFSFKVKMLKTYDFYFGYTQMMFWEIDETSWPFYDVNYNPEFFYSWHIREGILKSIDFGGYEHRSNGQDGDESRSWNRGYINFRTEFSGFGTRWNWDSKVFYFYTVEAENHSVRNTMGFFETALTARDIFQGTFRNADAQIRIVPGGKLDLKDPHGFQEFNFRFQLPYEEFNPYIFIQLYNGMNETMLDYKGRRTSYRIGFQI